MAVADVLQKISTSVGRLGQENGQFRQLAAQQNGSIGKFMRDIGKMFSNQSMQQSNLNNSLNNIEQTTGQTAQKVDTTNSLLGQSISLQTSMLGELKNISKSFEQMLEGQGEGGAQGTVNNILRSVGLLAGGAAIGAGAGAAAGYNAGANQGGNVAGVGSSDSAQKALDFFQSKGWSKEQAAGIVGNLQAESGQNLNPSIVGDGGQAYGIAQWHPDRQSNFEKQFGKSIGQASFEEQLQFVQWELENTEKEAGNKLKSAQSASEAAAIIDKFYERSSGAAIQNRIANANTLVGGGQEKDDASAPQGTIVQQEGVTPVSGYGNTGGGGGGSVRENQSQLAGIRKQPLSPRLKTVLQQAAAAAGVEAVVYSGGQPAKGSGGARTGSTRHDNGNAADLWLEKNGRKLSDTNPQDKAIMAKFVSAAVQAGATGVGAGHGYMGPSNIHVGFGKQATWGGADWIKSAASGVFSNKDLGGGSGGDSYSSGNYGEGSSNFSNAGGMGSTGGESFGGGLGGFNGGQAAGLQMPFPMMGMMGGGLGGIFGALAGITSLIGGMSSLFGGGKSQIASNDSETESESGSPVSASNNKESDDVGQILNKSPTPNPILNVQSEPPSIQRLQSAAVETDALKFNQPQQTQLQQPAELPNPSNFSRANDDLSRGGYPSQSAFSTSPSWYMQLAGRIHYDDALKFKGGVLA